jgi:His-Xaa-Ser system protein HxsD
MTVDVLVDPNVYPLEVVMGAAYVFVDRCFLLLDRVDGGRVRVTFTARPEAEVGSLEAMAGEFQNELLAQALRARLTERHEKLREALVARALFGAAPEMAPPAPAPTDAQLGLEGRFLPAEGDDYLDDPLGIAVPWEEKYAPADPAAAAPASTTPSTAGRDPR